MTTRQVVIAFIALLPCIGCGQTDPTAIEPKPTEVPSQVSSERSSGTGVPPARSEVGDYKPGRTEGTGNHYDGDRASDDPLAGFPATIIHYELVLQTKSDFPDADEFVRLKATIDMQRYAALVGRLQEMLRPKAKESGAGVLGLADPAERHTRGIVYFGPTCPITLTNAVNSAVTDDKGCVVIVGKELTKQPWKETRTGPAGRAPGGSKSIPIEWFWVSDQSAKPLRNGFRRACEMELQPVVLSTNGKVPLPIISPFAQATELLRNKTVLMLGGPAGLVFSAGTGGGALNLAGAQGFFVKSLLRYQQWPNTAIKGPEDVMNEERVLLFMPCMMIEGEFLATTILPVETSVLAKQVAGDDRIEIQPVFP